MVAWLQQRKLRLTNAFYRSSNYAVITIIVIIVTTFNHWFVGLLATI